jgi:hypothetical protein
MIWIKIGDSNSPKVHVSSFFYWRISANNSQQKTDNNYSQIPSKNYFRFLANNN